MKLISPAQRNVAVSPYISKPQFGKSTGSFLQ
jgi:hypothetical protein